MEIVELLILVDLEKLRKYYNDSHSLKEKDTSTDIAVMVDYEMGFSDLDARGIEVKKLILNDKTYTR